MQQQKITNSTKMQIKLLMLKKNVSNEDLASHFDTSIPAVSNAINGRRPQFQSEIFKYLKSL